MLTPDFTGARWRTSSRSGGTQNCVELAQVASRVAVRDTKCRDAGALAFSATAFGGFLALVKAGELDQR
ncbi:DUF397 domain-containing protein [Solihabitans fulvus]|uniref:DUF397 domain-containing protein n=1 Tax=Solihabitans fulvus TaxID=1892852 RepID=A0A5B2XN00_9PSEU|nr:DUF397 domain-containing protein [Solihabitans fulvus]KAA2264299.1 DUF397 domain-containing protein [Solihabitans fulvus]